MFTVVYIIVNKIISKAIHRGQSQMETDVLVIGGGISGCALAYFLAQDGLEVTLIERSGLNSAASGANSGSLHGQIPHDTFLDKGEEWAHNFGPTLSLMRESLEFWKTMEDVLEADLEVRLSGGLLVAKNEEEVKAVRAKAAIEKKFGIQSEYLDSTDLKNLAPYISDDMIGAMFYPEEGKANPLLVVPAFAAQAEKLGVRIIRQAEVEKISIQRVGFRVDTTRGSITCRRIGNCAGIDVGRISQMVGLTSTVIGDPIQTNVTEPLPPLVDHLVYSAGDRLTLKQTRHGSCLIGGGWPSSMDAVSGRLSVSYESVAKNLRVAIDMVPDLETAQLVRTWPARVNGTDDWIPILGEAETVNGFFINAFPWMGFTGGPISARLTADMMLNRPGHSFPA